MKIRVGYQGKHGTFSEIAALQYFEGKDPERIGYRNFPSIMKDVAEGKLDYALLPVENTTTGIISRTYDLFRSYEIHAVGEIDIPIREDLIVVPGTKLEEIRQVYSHPEALLQCAGFFAGHPQIESVSYQDTARSVEYIKDCNDRSKAALGSWRAAEYYGMERLIPEVQDSNTNMTRFLVVTAKDETPDDADKVSMMVILKHRPGALYDFLGILARRNINMLKLESRPITGRIFEYLFYIDFTGNTKSEETAEVIREMEAHCEAIRVLGCYKAASV